MIIKRAIEVNTKVREMFDPDRAGIVMFGH